MLWLFLAMFFWKSLEIINKPIGQIVISKCNSHHKEPAIPGEMTDSKTRYGTYKITLGHLVIQKNKEDIKEHKLM